MKTSRKTIGFTLIELLVVVVIVGILATLATVALNSSRAKARDAKRISDIKQLQTALELYFSDENGYPATADVVPGAPLTSLDKTKTFMAQVPSNPSPRIEGACTADADYSYSQDNGGLSYTLSYCLAKTVNGLPSGVSSAGPKSINNACVPNCAGKVCGEADSCGGKCSALTAAINSCVDGIGKCGANAACSGATPNCSAGGVCVACITNTDCGLCKKCSAGACVNQTASEDLKNECTAAGCNGANCSGSGSCAVYNDTLQHGCASGQNCSGGSCCTMTTSCAAQGKCSGSVSRGCGVTETCTTAACGSGCCKYAGTCGTLNVVRTYSVSTPGGSNTKGMDCAKDYLYGYNAYYDSSYHYDADCPPWVYPASLPNSYNKALEITSCSGGNTAPMYWGLRCITCQ